MIDRLSLDEVADRPARTYRVGSAAASISARARRISLPVGAGTEPLAAAARALDAAGVVLDDISLRRPTLDEVFRSLTGEALSDDLERQPA